MAPVLANQGDLLAPANACDSVDVYLKDATTFTTIASAKAQLNQNGSCLVAFNGSYNGNYYIAVQHRNAIETWSAMPVSISGNSSYNFTTAAAQAYNANQVEIAPGVFGFFSGDIVKDLNEAVELTDIAQLESDNSNFLFGLQASDINGDGGVDLGDFPLVEANVNGFIFSNHP